MIVLEKKVIDLSPKIFKLVSIVSILLIISNIAMDIMFNNSIHYSNIIPLIMLYIFCKYSMESYNKE